MNNTASIVFSRSQALPGNEGNEGNEGNILSEEFKAGKQKKGLENYLSP